MIGKLKGTVDSIFPDHIILDVMGIGFEVYISAMDILSLVVTEQISLCIFTQIRELDISLFGFKSESNKAVFIELLKVKGVGGKLAMSIMGQISANELAKAINSKDKDAIKQLSGVGPKLAERIIAELQSTKFNCRNDETNNSKPAKSRGDLLLQDALSALVNLGYSKNEVAQVTNFVYENNDNLTLSDLIKLSLKELAR